MAANNWDVVYLFVFGFLVFGCAGLYQYVRFLLIVRFALGVQGAPAEIPPPGPLPQQI